MKKFIIFMVFATAFVACGTPKAEEVAVVAADSTAVDTTVVSVETPTVVTVETTTVK